MKRLLDLRFVIGLFFLLVGLLLLIYGFASPSPTVINKWCGSIFIVFSLLMFLFYFTTDDEENT